MTGEYLTIDDKLKRYVESKCQCLRDVCMKTAGFMLIDSRDLSRFCGEL